MIKNISIACIYSLLFALAVPTVYARDWHPHYEDTCHVVTPTPTVTVTPTATPSATPTPQTGLPGDGLSDGGSSDGGATQAHNPVCTLQIAPPATPVFQRVSPTSVSFAWWKSTDNVDTQAIIYGYSPDSLVYGVILPNTSSSYEVGSLASNKTIYAKICAYKNGCSACSNVIDP